MKIVLMEEVSAGDRRKLKLVLLVEDNTA